MEFEHAPIYSPFGGWASHTRQYASVKNSNGSVFVHDDPLPTSLSDDAVSPFAGAHSFGEWGCNDAYESSMPIELPQAFDNAMDAQSTWARHHSIPSTLAPPPGSIHPGHIFEQQQSGQPGLSLNGTYSKCNSESDLPRLTSLQPKVIPSNDGSSSRAPSLTSSTSVRSSDLSNPASPTDIKMDMQNGMKRKSEDFTAQGIIPLVSEPLPKRKRGRPKLNRHVSSTCLTNSAGKDENARSRTPARLPHNQVERRYREGLNAELEKLRSAVPTLHYGEADPANATPKASKATVLAAAVDYIKSLEVQRECLFAENERLRTDGHGRGGWMLGGMG